MSTSTYLTTITNWAQISANVLPTVAEILAMPSSNVDDLVDSGAQFKVKAISTTSSVVSEVETITGQSECSYQVWYPLMTNVLMRTDWGINRNHVFQYILQTGGSAVTISFYTAPETWDPARFAAFPDEQSQFTYLYTVPLEANKWYNIQENVWWKLDGLTEPQISLWFANDTMNTAYKG